MNATIKCKECGGEKPPSSYFRVPKDSPRHSICMECIDADLADRRKARRAKFNERHQGRFTEYSRRWREKNPEKYAAQTALNNAVRDGKMTKGICEKCGRSDVEAHHDDYSKPLEVRWLCPTHHGATRLKSA